METTVTTGSAPKFTLTAYDFGGVVLCVVAGMLLLQFATGFFSK